MIYWYSSMRKFTLVTIAVLNASFFKYFFRAIIFLSMIKTSNVHFHYITPSGLDE